VSQERRDLVSITNADRLGFAIVAPILLGWYAWCRARGRIESGASLVRSLLAALKGPSHGALTGIVHVDGHCVRANSPHFLVSDERATSALEVLEDGRVLGPAHADHGEIASLGGGRFSHWDDCVWFSSSDGSDPRTNGRVYTWRERW